MLRNLARARVELGQRDHRSSAPTAPARRTCSRRSTSRSPAAPAARDRRDLIPFGGSLARAEATSLDGDGPSAAVASVIRAEGRRHLLDGSPPIRRRSLPTAPRRRLRPDRLALVKGPPAERRAHIDRFAAARWPSRSELRQRFGQALAQRNALLARVAARRRPGRPRRLGRDAGRGRRPADRRARRGGRRAGVALCRGRGRARPRRRRRDRLRAARPRAPRRSCAPGSRSAARRTCGSGAARWGPHLDEFAAHPRGPPAAPLRLAGTAADGPARPALRRARGAARRRGASTPLLLLDDVMSELDPERRGLLLARLAGGGQALITATDEDALPAGCAWAVDRDAGAPGAGRERRGALMSRRAPPARSAAAIRAALEQAAPKTPLAAVQSAWPRGRSASRSRRWPSRSPSATGRSPSAAPTPIWAQELDLMQEQLLARPRRARGAARCREAF